MIEVLTFNAETFAFVAKRLETFALETFRKETFAV
jgi:hypothetical protein